MPTHRRRLHHHSGNNPSDSSLENKTTIARPAKSCRNNTWLPPPRLITQLCWQRGSRSGWGFHLSAWPPVSSVSLHSPLSPLSSSHRHWFSPPPQLSLLYSPPPPRHPPYMNYWTAITSLRLNVTSGRASDEYVQLFYEIWLAVEGKWGYCHYNCVSSVSYQ